MYIYHLPYGPRQELCNILDQNNIWEELAGKYMKFDIPTISVTNLTTNQFNYLIGRL